MESPNYHLVQRIVGRWRPGGRSSGWSPSWRSWCRRSSCCSSASSSCSSSTGADVGDKVDALSDTAHVTPSQLAYLNLSLAAAIPVALFLTRVLHGIRPGWVSSVVGRLRWRWMAVTFGLAFVALLATVVVGSFVPASGDRRRHPPAG